MFELFSTSTWIFWLIAMIFFVVIEALTVNLISIWFVLGSLTALILALLNISTQWQMIAFFIISGIALFVFLYFVKPKLNQKIEVQEKTNADRIIEQEAIVVRTINPLENTGQVRVRGQIWSATTYNDEVIEEGTLVYVKELKGVKAYVTRKS